MPKEQSMYEMSKDGSVQFLVDLNDEIELDDSGIGKGYKVLYFKGKEQKFQHWMGEFALNTKIFKDFIINHKAKAVGRDLFVNYNHERTVAAGWYKDLYLADKNGKRLSEEELADEKNLADKGANVILADIEWTPNAQTAIKDKEYRYFSSEFALGQYKDSETGKVYENVYTGGALTNNPFMRKTNIELEEGDEIKLKEEKIMPTKKEMFVTLKDEHEVDVEQLLADSKKLPDVETKLEEANGKVETLETELADIKKASEESEIDVILADMLREGKSDKNLNDTVFKPLFLSVGVEAAKEKAKGLRVIVKLEAKGSEENEVEDNAATDLSDQVKLDKAALALSKKDEISYEEAVDQLLNEGGTE